MAMAAVSPGGIEKRALEADELASRLEVFFRERTYKELLKAAHSRGPLLVDFALLEQFDPQLADSLLEQPADLFKAIEAALQNIDFGQQLERKIIVRFTNIPNSQTIAIRDLRSAQIGKLIAVKGVIKQASEVKPEITEATFECEICGAKIKILQDTARLKRPYMCECGNKRGFDLKARELIDIQRIVVEESPDAIEGGAQPRKVSVYLRDDLTDPKFQRKVVPGNKVIITGILNDVPIRVFQGTEGESKRRDIYIDGNWLEAIEQEFEEIDITPEDEVKIKELAARADIYEVIIQSIAPSIFGYEEIKEAVALQLFGGIKKQRADGVVTRGDVHVFLVGDPGVAKSQLLRYVSILAPKARYVVGTSASGAGITATVVRDEFIKGWALEAGALVLTNRGLCCIDEVDKMSAEDRVRMHEVMEQQSYAPDFEIMLANGAVTKIGQLVDALLERGPVKKLKDCEIMPATIDILTADQQNIFKARSARVSRHTPPAFFYRITFGHGRSVTVTPEHPMFIFDGAVRELPAESVRPGMWAFAPRVLKTEPLPNIALRKPQGEKGVKLPGCLTPELARFLGYLASEGHAYKNDIRRYAEVGVTNTNQEIIAEVTDLFSSLFARTPNVQVQVGRGYGGQSEVHIPRLSSNTFYEYLRLNFPELIASSLQRRVPNLIRAAMPEIRRAFLSSYFAGDGFVDSERFGFVTASKAMACDLQDLLLMDGVWSYITTEKRGTSKYFKAIVSGTPSMTRFLEIVGASEKTNRAARIARRSANRRNYRDVLPPPLVKRVYDLLKQLRLLDGYFNSILKHGQNSNREVIAEYLRLADERVATLSHNRDSTLRRKSLLGTEEMEHIKSELENLKRWVFGDLRFVRVAKVERIDHHDARWVYDVTIEPTHTFISGGLLLHNTVTISKANIQATLNAQTTILAAANPKFGRFDPYATIAEQINLPPTLLNRFDLIFSLKDSPDPERDTRMVRHMLRLHEAPESIEGPLSSDMLRKFVAYAKLHCRPQLTKAAEKEIEKFYVSLRNKYSGEEAPVIPISPRQLEALVRLSEASAKVRLSSKVTEDDAKRAIRLLTACLQQVALDLETGKLDIDKIESGTTSTQRNKIRTMLRIVSELENDSEDRTASFEDVIAEAEQQGIDEPAELIDKLRRDGELFEPRRGRLKRLK